MRLVLAALCFVALGACRPPAAEAPKASCPELRSTFDKAFSEAVQAGAAKRWEEQKTHIREGEKAVLAMEEQGCCREAGACPALNVR